MKFAFSILLITLLQILQGCTNSDSEEPRTDACGNLGLQSRSLIGSQTKGLKIIQGTECSRTGSPIVSLTLLLNNGGVALCSGTVISSRHILTAGHCFDSEVTGVSAQVQGSDYPSTSFAVHPNYTGKVVPTQNDVAIVEVGQDLPVSPVPIILSRNIEPRDIISIYGYGNDENSNSGVLRSGEMRVSGINSQYFIATFNEEGSNICQGDSGGPAILRIENANGDEIQGIVGITSFGQLPCDNSGKSGFQNVQSSSVTSFITSLVPSVRVE